MDRYLVTVKLRDAGFRHCTAVALAAGTALRGVQMGLVFVFVIFDPDLHSTLL